MRPALITDPWFYVSAALAVLVLGVAKGGLGGGIGVIGVPLMALTIGPIRAAAILLPLLMVMDALALRRYWRRWHSNSLRMMLPGALAGTLIGWLTFELFSADTLRVLIGSIALYYAGGHFLSRAGNKPARTAGWFAGTGWGALAGFTSFGIHAGGPPAYAFLLPQKLDRTTFQATLIAFFFLVNWSKVLPYLLLGQLDVANIATSAVLLPLAPLGVMLGGWLHTRVNEAVFFHVVYASLLLVGGKLVWDGLGL